MPKFIQNLLADQGYSIIALPKAGVTPLQLLIQQQKVLSAYGDSLLKLFEPDEAGLPVRTTNTADISGKKLVPTDAKTGIQLLSGLFNALKLNSSKLEASLNIVRGLELAFSYTDIQEESVELMALDNFIVGAIPRKEGFKSSQELLKNGELYVITSVLKSANFQVSLSSANATDAELKAAVEGIADLNTHFKRAGSNSFSLATPDGEAMAFAFKAAKILYDQPGWFQFWNREEARFRIKDQRGMVLKGPEDFPVCPFHTEYGIAEIKEA